MVASTVVAPHWGAWIEILWIARGARRKTVAPHWGAWIEISSEAIMAAESERRTPLGCVD